MGRSITLLVVVAAVGGCSTTPASCGADDLDCFMDHLGFQDFNGADLPVYFVDATAVATISTTTSSSPTVPVITSEPVSLTYMFGTIIAGDAFSADRIDVGFDDPNNCQPMLAFTLAKNGVHSKHTGCFPGIRDNRRTGDIMTAVGFTAEAPEGATFDLLLNVVSSPDCTSIDQPAALITATGVEADNPITVPVTIAPPSTGGGTCSGGDLLVSTLDCDPLGSGGQSSYCLSAAEYTGATGMPLPAACYPAGTTGCEGESGSTAGTLVKPCCPGLTCKVGSACGDPTGAVGGSCQ